MLEGKEMGGKRSARSGESQNGLSVAEEVQLQQENESIAQAEVR